MRDKVSRAQRYLPRDCDPPTVSKADADASPIMQIAIRSNKRSLMELSEIAELTVKERLQTIEEREWRGYLGTKTVFHASMAGPNQDGGLRSDPDGREKRRR